MSEGLLWSNWENGLPPEGYVSVREAIEPSEAATEVIEDENAWNQSPWRMAEEHFTDLLTIGGAGLTVACGGDLLFHAAHIGANSANIVPERAIIMGSVSAATFICSLLHKKNIQLRKYIFKLESDSNESVETEQP